MEQKKGGRDFGSLLDYCPNEFNLNHHELGDLFCYAALGVDNHIRGKIRGENPEYLAVIRSGKILYQYTERAKLRIRKDATDSNPITDIFFFKFLKEQGEKPKTVEDIANSVMQIGLDIIKIRELSETRNKELRDICLKLSKRASSYWHELNPMGFKHYCAA